MFQVSYGRDCAAIISPYIEWPLDLFSLSPSCPSLNCSRRTFLPTNDMPFNSNLIILVLGAFAFQSTVCVYSECSYVRKPNGLYRTQVYLYTDEGWKCGERLRDQLLRVCGGEDYGASIESYGCRILIESRSIDTVFCIQGMLTCPVDEPLGSLESAYCVYLPFRSVSLSSISRA